MEQGSVEEVAEHITSWFTEFSLWVKALILVAVLFVTLLIGVGAFYALCVDFVDNYELAYKYDARSGKIERIGRTGYVITPPFLVKVHKIDLRPMQVCNNANSRVLNCKLVEFNPAGLEQFLAWHGRDDYSGDESRLPDILKSYAYDGSGKSYPFLTIKRELKPDEASGVGVVPTPSAVPTTEVK